MHLRAQLLLSLGPLLLGSLTLNVSGQAAGRHAAALMVSWHSSASRPDSCSREFTPSLMRMCVNPICCTVQGEGHDSMYLLHRRAVDSAGCAA